MESSQSCFLSRTGLCLSFKIFKRFRILGRGKACMFKIFLTWIFTVYSSLALAQSQSCLRIPIENELSQHIAFYMIYDDVNHHHQQVIFQVDPETKKVFEEKNIILSSLLPPNKMWFVPLTKPTQAYSCLNFYNGNEAVLHVLIRKNNDCFVF